MTVTGAGDPPQRPGPHKSPTSAVLWQCCQRVAPDQRFDFPSHTFSRACCKSDRETVAVAGGSAEALGAPEWRVLSCGFCWCLHCAEAKRGAKIQIGWLSLHSGCSLQSRLISSSVECLGPTEWCALSCAFCWGLDCRAMGPSERPFSLHCGADRGCAETRMHGSCTPLSCAFCWCLRCRAMGPSEKAWSCFKPEGGKGP